MKNEQSGKLAKRAELPRVKLEYAPKQTTRRSRTRPTGPRQTRTRQTGRAKLERNPNMTALSKHYQQQEAAYCNLIDPVYCVWLPSCCYMLIHYSRQSKLILWPNKTKDDNQQSVMVWKGIKSSTGRSYCCTKF